MGLDHTWTSLPSPTPSHDDPHVLLLTSLRTGSGLLTTADSATAGCSARAFSTSAGPMRYLQDQWFLLSKFQGYGDPGPQISPFGEIHLPLAQKETVTGSQRPVQRPVFRGLKCEFLKSGSLLWHENSLSLTFVEILCPVPKLCNVSFHFLYKLFKS